MLLGLAPTTIIYSALCRLTSPAQYHMKIVRFYCYMLRFEYSHVLRVAGQTLRDLGSFGKPHVDGGDMPEGFTSIQVCSDLPQQIDPGASCLA